MSHLQPLGPAVLAVLEFALGALEPRLADAFETDVRFRRPILLPAKVEFATTDADKGDEIDFTVRGHGKRRDSRHLDGRITPVAPKTSPKGKAK